MSFTVRRIRLLFSLDRAYIMTKAIQKLHEQKQSRRRQKYIICKDLQSTVSFIQQSVSKQWFLCLVHTQADFMSYLAQFHSRKNKCISKSSISNINLLIYALARIK